MLEKSTPRITDKKESDVEKKWNKKLSKTYFYMLKYKYTVLL